MKLKAGAEVVGAGPVIGDGVVLTITSDSAAKATPYEEFESKGRGGQGVRVASWEPPKRSRCVVWFARFDRWARRSSRSDG